MALYVLTNCKHYLGGYDLSGDLNRIEIKEAYDEVEATTFGCAARYALPGLSRVSYSMDGYAQHGTGLSETVLAANLATQDAVVTVCPTDGTAGENAYISKGLQTTLDFGGEVGGMASFTVTGTGSGAVLTRGTIMANAQLSATGNGTARQLGAVSASQKLYAAMHVLAVSGTSPTLDMVVQSDDAEGFASAASRITFTQATAIGAQYATPVSGAITDDWWRLSYTIGGTASPSFTVVVTVGIK